MIQVVVKVPEEKPYTQEINSVETLQDIMEGDYELTQDDLLPGIHMLVNEDLRGMKPHNFTIQSNGTHDWVYGTAVFIAIEGEQMITLTEEQIKAISDYFAKTRGYK